MCAIQYSLSRAKSGTHEKSLTLNKILSRDSQNALWFARTKDAPDSRRFKPRGDPSDDNGSSQRSGWRVFRRAPVLFENRAEGSTPSVDFHTMAWQALISCAGT